MALELLKSSLSTAEAKALAFRMSLDAYATEQQIYGDKVALSRRYRDGDHDANLTPEMKKMQRVSSDNDRLNDNYMDIVVSTMVDRLQITGFECDNDGATAWTGEVTESNRFDALQQDTHDAAICDGNTFLLVSWDNTLKQVVISHEPAWDGSSGMLVVHNPAGQVVLGIKSWQESLGAVTRINLYYADHIERYISQSGELGSLMPYKDHEDGPRSPWLWNSEPIGCPVVHLPNRGTSWNAYGLSEIENVIPLQNAVNRTLYSMIMTEELSAFPVRYFIGCKGPTAVMPGMNINIGNGEPLAPDQKVELGTFEQADLTPYIESLKWLTGEIGRISRTPAPEFMGSDDASGESLKQREIGLIGKCQRFQTKAGNRWEDAMKLAWRVQAAFGSAPPAFKTISAQWADVELRNDKEVVENAQVLADMGYDEEALRQMAPVFKWDEKKIQELLAQKQASKQASLAAFASVAPQFNTFGQPGNGNGNGAAQQPQEGIAQNG